MKSIFVLCPYRRPPPRCRDAGEVGLGHVVFHGVNHGGETEDAHGDEQEEAAHLLVALAQGKAECPQPRGVAGQLQDAEDAHQPHDAQHLAQLAHLLHGLHVGLVLHVVFVVVEELQHQLQVLRQDGDQVHCVEHTPAEGLQVRRGHQAQQVLHGEEGDAHRLHVLKVGPPTECPHEGPVLHVLHGVQGHGHQGDQHKHAGGHGHELGQHRGEGLLHQVPDGPAIVAQEHVLEELLVFLDLHLGLQLPLDLQLIVQVVLPLLEGYAAAAVGVLDPHPPVVDLLQEVAGAQLILDPQHARTVKVEDAEEHVRVPVKEVLVVGDSVVVAQVQLHVVVRVGGQSSYSGLGILSGHPVGYLVRLAAHVDVDHVVFLWGMSRGAEK